MRLGLGGVYLQLATVGPSGSPTIKDLLGDFCGTFGPQDGLVLPAGWVFADRAHGNTDTIGLKAMWLDLKSLDPLSQLNDRFHALNKANETLNKVANFLTVYEPPA